MAAERAGRIAVVGGGIAGLTLAIALAPQRWEVRLYEAEPGRGGHGAALGVWPSARRALERIGVSLPGAPSGRARVGLFDLSGRRVLELRGPDLQLIERPRLLAALEAALPDGVDRRDEVVTDPAALDADVVVGADGVRSGVRGLVHPAGAQRIATPYVALRGIGPPEDPAVLGEYWGAGRLFGAAPLPDGRTYWFTTHRSDLGPEPLAAPAVIAQARDVFADGSAPVIARTLERAAREPEGVVATRLWVAPALPRYVRGRFVVIGDAAHASLPNLGRGACDAILDATSLARALDSGGAGVPPTWQARRLPPTQAARAIAGGIMRLALSRRGSALRGRLLEPARPSGEPRPPRS